MRAGFWSALLLSAALLIGMVALFAATNSERRGSAAAKTRGAEAANDVTEAPDDAPAKPLVLYCAAGAKPPIEAAVRRYTEEYGGEVQIEYGGSGALLARIVAAPIGDLYLAADDSFLQAARDKQLIDETLPLALQSCVLATPLGNPRSLKSLDDLLAPNVRVGLATPDATAVGQVARQIATAAGIWPRLEEAVTERGVFKPTVTDLANDLKLGTIDAALVWDSTVASYPELAASPIEHPANQPQHVTLSVLKCSRQPTAALRLARYLAARDRGQEEFARRGYATEPADRWAERPEITVHCGSVLRVAVQQTIAEFAAREDVVVNTVFNGCGILVGQMKAGDRSDGYFACDRSFMGEVGDLFFEPTDLARMDMVICVPRDNPRQIKRLADLAQPGLKVGVCNEQQSALGLLTAKLLRATGNYEAVMASVVSQVPTGDLLVTQMRARGLDAAIVYRANFWRHREELAAVEIDADDKSAVQPFAIGAKSEHPRLVGRLLEALRSSASRARFAESGFEWIAGAPTADAAGSDSL